MMRIEKFVNPFLRFIVSHPRMVLGIFCLCALPLAWQSRNFKIDASAETLLMKEDKNYIQTQIVYRRFSPQEFLLVAYKPKNHSLLSEQTFTDLKTLSEKLRGLDRVESVRSILNVPLFPKMEGGLSKQTDMSEHTLENHAYSINELKEIFHGHPIYEDLLINKDQTATAIQVLFKRDENLVDIENQIIDLQEKSLHRTLSDVERREISALERQTLPIHEGLDKTRISEIEEIRKIQDGYADSAEIYMGGLHVLAYQLIRIIKNDLIVFGSTIGGMICLVLYLLFRSMRWVLIPVICCGCSLLVTMGLFGSLGLKTTVISANFIVLQFILTLAIVMHLIVQYREYSVLHPDWEQGERVRETLLKMAGPCFYSSFTTLVGFGSLLTCTIQPVIAFGWMMIIAMLVSMGVSLTLFPAMMVLFSKEKVSITQNLSKSILDFFTYVSLKRSSLTVVITVLVLGSSVGGIFLLNVENSFINYFRASTQIHKELSFIDKEFGGSTPLDIVYTFSNAERKKDLVLTADTVQILQHIQQALKKHEAFGKILSVVSFTEIAKQINAGKPLTEYELTSVYWTMEDALRSDLLGSFFSSEDVQARFSVRVKDSTKDLNRAELISDIKHDMEQLDIPEKNYLLTGLFVLYQDILQQLFRSQVLTLGTAFGLLALTFLVVFRSVKLALIGITPSVLPTLALLGLMGWLGISLDLMTITIAAITMGVSVDDTIHYTHRYLEELQNGSTEEQAVQNSHGSVGYAMLYTALIIILGLSLLTFSDFVPSILFALLTGLVMTLALVYNLCLLPILLVKFISKA